MPRWLRTELAPALASLRRTVATPAHRINSGKAAGKGSPGSPTHNQQGRFAGAGDLPHRAMTQPAKSNTETRSVRALKVTAAGHMVIYRQGNQKLSLHSPLKRKGATGKTCNP